MKTIKAIADKKAILFWMMCMALKDCKFEYAVSEEDAETIEFTDPLINIHGFITLENKSTYKLFFMDETYEAPAGMVLKSFKSKYMPEHSELLIDGGDKYNTLLFYYEDIPITDSTSIITFQSVIMKAVLNVLQFRSVINEYVEDNE